MSLDFQRKYLRAFPFFEEDKVGVRGRSYAVMILRDFISFCLFNKFVFRARPSTNGIIQMNLARIGELKL